MTDIINRNVLFKQKEPMLLPAKNPDDNTPKEEKKIPQELDCSQQEDKSMSFSLENKDRNEKVASIFGQSEAELDREFRAYKAAKIFRKFDYDLTNESDPEILSSKVEEAIKYGFGNIIVTPKQVKFVKQKLKGKKIGVFAAVCYPLGEESYGVKKYASKMAFSEGADGIYLPIGVYDVLKGRLEGIRREFAKIVRQHKRKKVFVVMETAKFDISSCEKVLKTFSKIKIAGIVSGTGGFKEERLSSVSELHSLSGGKRSIIACSTSEKSREVINLFSVADRIFLKNAPKIAVDLKTNLEY